MTINIDDDIILPIITAILAVTFTIGYQTLVPRSAIDELVYDNDALFLEVSAANREIDTLTKELHSYRATVKAIESLGASHTQAIQVIKAAEEYDLDPKH